MKEIRRIEFKNDRKEELLPGYSPDFPYIASLVDTDKLTSPISPWHWHREVELFYIVHGTLEYFTPSGSCLFPAGTGGLINSNVLHMTRPRGGTNGINMLHIFDPVLISGGTHSRIHQKYVAPLTSCAKLELVALHPDQEEHEPLLELLRQSFQLSETDYAYEIRLRAILSQIWCGLLDISRPQLNTGGRGNSRSDEKVKLMLAFIQAHFQDPLSVADIAASAFISQRECFRAFKNTLHTTPLEYLKTCRLQAACQLLADSAEPVTFISQSCGLGSSSYFGKIFRCQMGCTPLEYRAKWQNRDINRRN